MIWPFKPKFRKQIARIEITGAIASGTRKRVLEAIKTVEEKKFPALLLRIDSPGGTVGDSQEIYSALKELGKKTKIVASFGNISASGGVYIGMGAEHIMANPGTITGSIGVILRGNNRLINGYFLSSMLFSFELYVSVVDVIRPFQFPTG